MKVIVTALGNTMDSEVDPRFGRAKYFLVVDTDTNSAEAHDNTPNLNAPQGAGIQAGRKVAGLGAKTLLTGHVGPKAFATLQAAGITIYTGATGTVAEAIEQFKNGKLTSSGAPDVQGHWT